MRKSIVRVQILKRPLLITLLCLVIGWFAAARLLVTPVGGAFEISDFRWRAEDVQEFGGFSGLEISKDGRRLTALTDRSHVFDAAIMRDGAAIIRVEDLSIRRLISHMDVWLDTINSDTEALAGDVDGLMYLSSEGRTSVYSLLPTTNEVVWIETGGVFRELPGNQGIEAMAIDPQGRLYAIPEALRRAGGTIPVFVWDNGNWSEAYQIPQVPGFDPVGADFGPDGKLYLLERRYSRILGVANQIRRIDLLNLTIAPEVLLRTRFLDYGNLEGLAVWQSGDDIRVTTISDNNFWFFLPTRIVEFQLTTRTEQ